MVGLRWRGPGVTGRTMEGLEQGAPPEPRAGRGRRARGDQATDAHTTLRPALRVVVVVVVVPRLLTELTDNGGGRRPSTPGAPATQQAGYRPESTRTIARPCDPLLRGELGDAG